MTERLQSEDERIEIYIRSARLFLLYPRLQRGDIDLAAERHNRDLAGTRIWHHDLCFAVLFEQRDVTRLCAARWQIEGRPFIGIRVVFEDDVRGPNVKPCIVVLVD